MKIFLWRFCGNNVPVRNRLKAKGVTLPISYPFCTDVEHLLHLFFDYLFAQDFWRSAGIVYDMSSVYYAPDWLIGKIEMGTREEVHKISTILYGIRY